jgi:hypothetical protein
MTRRTRVIDTAPFEAVVEEAIVAFSTDPSYAIMMARQSSTIAHKRAIWALRIELRKAEADAVQQCRTSEPFVCSNQGPCGTGPGCRFARGDLALLEVEPSPHRAGKSVRPMPSEHERSYSIETAVRPLHAARTAAS